MRGDELIVLEASPERDPDGSILRAALDAHLEAERLHAVRLLLLHALALVGLPVWLGAAWPALLPATGRRLALVAWVSLLVAVVATVISEARWLRRLARADAQLAKPRTMAS